MGQEVAMRKPRGFRIALVLIASCLCQPLVAQLPRGEVPSADPGALQRIELSDGTELRGWVVVEDNPIQFRLISGHVLELERSGIRKITPARGQIVDGKFVREDPNRTRLFFAPTGRGLSKGQGYFAVYEIVMPFLAVAPVDNLVLSGGTPLLFGGGGDRPFWFAPKVRVAGGEKVDVAVGAIAIGGLGGGDVAGIAFGVATFGDHAQALTTGIGFGWTGSEWSDKPVVMIGGEIAASNGIKLVSENYFLPGEGGLVSLGPRFFGERLTADLGIAVPLTGGETFAFPIVNFVWNW
jgi:hypothetical protein